MKYLNHDITTNLVALSGGKDSTAMALRLKELNPDVEYTYLITPTGDELPDMIAHWKHLADILGKPLIPITSGKSLKGLIRDLGRLPNWRERWCTKILKLDPYAKFMERAVFHIGALNSYVGLRADEEEREGGDFRHVIGVTQRYPMREWGWTINSEKAARTMTKAERRKAWKIWAHRYRERHPDRYHFANLKSNARRRGKIFTITLEDFRAVWIPGESIDRIDHWRGYEPGNIQSLPLPENSAKGYREKIEKQQAADQVPAYSDEPPF
jgi:hypothetical protein